MRPARIRRGYITGWLAALAAIVFALLLILLLDTEPVRAIPLTAFVFLFYVPLGYYTDQLIYRRRQKLEAKKNAA